jgi:hypothetical protein
MVRYGLAGVLFLVLCATATWAGQASATFTVGITIGGKAGHRPQEAVHRKIYTWGAAEITLRRAGFTDLQHAQQSSSLYWFMASKAGASYRVSVSIDSGQIIEIIPA